MSGGPWRGGIAVRRMQRGQVPIADFLCALCLHHRRVTGRQLVRDFLASDPIAVHRTTCTATSERPVTRIDGAPNPKE